MTFLNDTIGKYIKDKIRNKIRSQPMKYRIIALIFHPIFINLTFKLWGESRTAAKRPNERLVSDHETTLISEVASYSILFKNYSFWFS